MATNPFDTIGSSRVSRSLATFASIALLVACSSNASDGDENEQEAASRSSGGSGGSGGRGGSGGNAGSSPLNCPAASEAVDPTATIDDMEDQDAYLVETNGRKGGGWWTAGDETPGATIVPERTDLTDELAAPEPIPNGRCGSSFALHVTGQGFLDWGALFGANLIWATFENGEEGPVPYDASAHTGVQFWARIGDTSTNRVRFAVSDVNNEPAGGVCEEDGGPGEECFDTFGTYLPQLDTTWRHYQVPFSGLRQRDFGFPANAAAADELYTIQFNFDPGAIFDLWVDNVAFY